MKEEFWSHIAEFPSHHRDLPPNAESRFVQSVATGEVMPISLEIIIYRFIPWIAKSGISDGTLFCFTEEQIDKIIARYQELIGGFDTTLQPHISRPEYQIGFRAQGRTVTSSLSWLIGAVMPLEPISREVGGHNIDHILYGNY